MDVWEIDANCDLVQFNGVYGPPFLEGCSYIFIKSSTSDSGIVLSEEDGTFVMKGGIQDMGNVYPYDDEVRFDEIERMKVVKT